jgi:hypothetical protein
MEYSVHSLPPYLSHSARISKNSLDESAYIVATLLPQKEPTQSESGWAEKKVDSHHVRQMQTQAAPPRRSWPTPLDPFVCCTKATSNVPSTCCLLTVSVDLHSLLSPLYFIARLTCLF